MQKNKIFFTSNTCFGDKYSSKNRGFKTVEEMNQTIINNWNEKVKDDCIVYFLGNFAYEPLSAELMINLLNGQIIFLPSKMDAPLFDLKLDESRHKVANSICKELDNVLMCIYPFEYFHGMENNKIHIFGLGESNTVIKPECIKINAGINRWNYKPLSLEEIEDLVDTFIGNDLQA